MSRTTLTTRVAVGLLALVVALTGVAGLTALLGDDSTGGDDAAGGDVPATPQALAWVAGQHLPTPEVGLSYPDRAADGAGFYVGLDYARRGKRGGTEVAVSVLPLRRTLDCKTLRAEPTIDGCEVREGATVFWQEAEPKEDPGVLYVEVVKGDTSVVVFQQGPKVPADIDDFEAEASLADMIAAAKDPRLDLTTTQEAVDEGERLPWWRGEPQQ